MSGAVLVLTVLQSVSIIAVLSWWTGDRGKSIYFSRSSERAGQNVRIVFIGLIFVAYQKIDYLSHDFKCLKIKPIKISSTFKSLHYLVYFYKQLSLSLRFEGINTFVQQSCHYFSDCIQALQQNLMELGGPSPTQERRRMKSNRPPRAWHLKLRCLSHGPSQTNTRSCTSTS